MAAKDKKKSRNSSLNIKRASRVALMYKKTQENKMRSSSKKLAQDIWPSERDVMMRPDRLRYVRKLIKTDGCVFCNAHKSGVGVESLCVYKNKHAMLVLNKFPYNSGHILVLPTRHVGSLLELTEDEFNEIQKLIRETVKAIQEEYQPPGLNIGLNMGAVAGAGIPEHLHWHIIPRWHGDTNFFPIIAETKVLAQTNEQVYEKYRNYFSKIK